MPLNPVKVIRTDNWLDECLKYQNTLGIKNPLIVTSEGNKTRLNLTSIFNDDSIFYKIVPNPSFESCQVAIDFCKQHNFDGIIGVGGGSVLDTSKVMMAAIGTQTYKLRKLLDIQNNFFQRIPAILIPTTHGTGSEVTMWGTIWNAKEKKKYSISHLKLYPDIAILDAKLTQTLQIDTSIITCLDALSHGFEAIWNKNANPKSTQYAINAICIILENIEKFKLNPNNIKLRQLLLNASNMAGLAISNTKTAAAHSISYPLTIHYDIPHGLACYLPLGPLLKINKIAILKELGIILENLKIDKLSELENLIKNAPLGSLNLTLRYWGVRNSELQEIADQSFTKGRMDNNIINLTYDDVFKILNSIY